jgi:glycosyltransferase involved in cell wall biosynthesis
MKIFAICMVKNDGDIIEYNLTESSKWADKIFIYDNGSTDNSWEIIQELSKNNDRIIPYKKENIMFRPHLRAEVFNHYRHLANEGDWWCLSLDTDEFYIDNPKEFLPKVPKFYQAVISESYEYKLTWEDIEELEFTNHSPHDAQQLSYYSPKTYAELRFFRHRNRLKWNPDEYPPKRAGIIYPLGIRLKHLQYRSPDQIQKRLDLRRKVMESGYKQWKHDDFKLWSEKVEYRKDLIKESPDFFNAGPKYPNLHFPKSYFSKIKNRYIPMIFHYLKIFP